MWIQIVKVSNFQQTGSNWQESAVLGHSFQVTVISPIEEFM